MNKNTKNFQGTAALIIGVVFVVLAGLIFATTAWHTLPNISKVVMVLGFACLFFGASDLTKKRFGIYKTSQAFYILGSVFLFLTILAIGYFKLLGTGFTLDVQNRYKVLCAGSIVTELALAAGIKTYQDSIYTKSCFWGLSVSVIFLLKALGLTSVDVIKGMACYSSLLLITCEWSKERRAAMPTYMVSGLTSFVEIHFWLFGILVVCMAALEGLALLLIGLLGYGQPASFSTTFALGMITAGAVVMTVSRKQFYLQVMHSILAIVFFHYVGLCFRIDLIYQLLLAEGAIAIWFFSKKRKYSILSSIASDCMDTVVIVFDSLTIFMIALWNWDSIGCLVAVSAAVLMLAAIVAYLSKQCQLIRVVIPFILYPLTLTVTGMVDRAGITALKYYHILFLFLLAAVVRDVAKRDRFYPAVMMIGTTAQLFVWALGIHFPLFVLLLAGYQFVLCGLTDGSLKERHEKGAGLYLLAGIYLLVSRALITGHVVDALIVEGVCLAIFIRANIKQHVLWQRISGTIIVAVALYMTKDFWLSLSWWVCLLAAGLGLIIFAAISESKKQG